VCVCVGGGFSSIGKVGRGASCSIMAIKMIMSTGVGLDSIEGEDA